VHTVLFVLALFNLTVFAVAMKWLFRKPAHASAGVRSIYIVGAFSSALTVVGFLQVSRVGSAPQACALLLYLASLSLFAWAASTSGRQTLAFALSGEHSRVLVTSGPYALIRHPFYTAYWLTWLAGLVATQRLWMAVPPVAMGALYCIAATREEGQLRSGDLTGRQYAAYCATTGRFFPRLPRL